MSRGNIEFLSSRQGLEDAGSFISAMNSQHNLTTWITFGGSYPGRGHSSARSCGRQTDVIYFAQSISLL